MSKFDEIDEFLDVEPVDAPKNNKIEKVEKKEEKDSPKTVNNALFVGSTSDLSKLLKKGVLNNKVENEEE